MRLNSKQIIDGLDKVVENPHCELKFETPFQLLISVILSAQCTDKRVNMVTEKLFKLASTPKEFVDMPVEMLEKSIYSCGFYHNKAKSIKSASEDVLNRFAGNVPDKFEDLVSLAGVGRKTANVVMAVAFNRQAIAVDTHVLRVSNRLGLVDTKNPYQCEMQLQKIFPEQLWSKLHYQMVLFGRYTCKAIKPDCENCVFNANCPSSKIGVPSIDKNN